MRIVDLGFQPVTNTICESKEMTRCWAKKRSLATLRDRCLKVTLDLQAISHRFNGFFILISFLLFFHSSFFSDVRFNKEKRERFNSKLFHSTDAYKKSFFNGNFSTRKKGLNKVDYDGSDARREWGFQKAIYWQKKSLNVFPRSKIGI